MADSPPRGPGRRWRVGIVGAGGISEMHARMLVESPATELVAVADPHPVRARSLAGSFGVEEVHESVEALIASGSCEAAHVLVPPDLHRRVAEPLLAAGLHVFVEKPMATSSDDCEALIRAARLGEARLGVNHNLLFDPTFARLEELVRSGRIGHLQHLDAVWNVPLPPLTIKQFGQWMFREPGNIVLEQAVHPLSALLALAGKPLEVQCLTSPPRELVADLAFIDTWMVSLRFEEVTAQLFLSFEQPMKVVSVTAICTDGVARADLDHKLLVVEERSCSELFERSAVGLRQARGIVRQSWREAVRSTLHPLRLEPDPTPFAQSMKASIERFYARIESGGYRSGGRFSAGVVEACEQILERAPACAEPDAARAGRARENEIALVDSSVPCDVALIGGTGVIGRMLVSKLAAQGRAVRVMARNARFLPDLFRADGVRVMRGDAERAEDVERLVAGARTVVDLYYPGEGAGVDRRMAESAERIALACLEAGVQRLVYLSSLAALYLGDPGEVVTGSTPSDPRDAERPEYSRGKGASERRLAEMHREKGLPVCILRPGIVIGEGGYAQHPGIGRFVTPQHCVGWNDGKNPMAFVLVDDVADAILLALDSEASVGKTYNLVGDVPMSGREYVAELGRVFGRPLRYEARHVSAFWLAETAKWILKRLAGRGDAKHPGTRDFRSRGMVARFDCSDVKRDLGWRPVSDRAEFVRRGIEVYAPDLRPGAR